MALKDYKLMVNSWEQFTMKQIYILWNIELLQANELNKDKNINDEGVKFANWSLQFATIIKNICIPLSEQG